MDKKRTLPLILITIILLLLIFIYITNKLRFDLHNSKSCKKVLHSIECSTSRNIFYRFDKKFKKTLEILRTEIILIILLCITHILILYKDYQNIYYVVILVTLILILIAVFLTY